MNNSDDSGFGFGIYALLVAGFVVLATALVLTLLEKPPEHQYYAARVKR